LSELDASATSERLDSVAKVLAGSTAAAAALLTTFGLTSDRVWLLLDQDRLANSLVLTSVAAVLAIGCSLIALLIPPSRYGVQAGVLAVGALLYIGALVGVLLVAGEAGDRAGAPLIQSATIRDLQAIAPSRGASSANSSTPTSRRASRSSWVRTRCTQVPSHPISRDESISRS
jgi:hypothetical protein